MPLLLNTNSWRKLWAICCGLRTNLSICVCVLLVGSLLVCLLWLTCANISSHHNLTVYKNHWWKMLSWTSLCQEHFGKLTVFIKCAPSPYINHALFWLPFKLILNVLLLAIKKPQTWWQTFQTTISELTNQEGFNVQYCNWIFGKNHYLQNGTPQGYNYRKRVYM